MATSLERLDTASAAQLIKKTYIVEHMQLASYANTHSYEVIGLAMTCFTHFREVFSRSGSGFKGPGGPGPPEVLPAPYARSLSSPWSPGPQIATGQRPRHLHDPRHEPAPYPRIAPGPLRSDLGRTGRKGGTWKKRKTTDHQVWGQFSVPSSLGPWGGIHRTQGRW